jgi:AbrB family looped-hinge helix DNA binding protein
MAYQERANMETVKVSSKGQIVIPKALREAGHIHAGTELIISAIADGLMLIPAQRIKPTKVADGLGMLAEPDRKKLSDAEVKRRIATMLKMRDEATKTR